MVGNGWSVAWRVYDAQYWGVPQRRKRIYLVADFGSECAGEILFKSESVSGDFEKSETTEEGIAADTERSVRRSCSVKCLNPRDSQSIRQYDVEGVAPSLNANNHGGQNRWGVCFAIEGNTVDRNSNKNGCGWCVDRGQNVICYGVDCRNVMLDKYKTHTLCAKNKGISLNYTPCVCYRSGGYGTMTEGVGTLRANGGDVGGVQKQLSLR